MEEKRRDRIQAAADHCSELLSEGWADAVAERAADYVSQESWNRMFQRHRNQCKALARLAQRILYFKDQIHDWIGTFVARILELIGVGKIPREFAAELATNIPITPVDAKIIAVARGLQVAGIALCSFRAEDITRCQCFIDLALAETKTQVRKILAAAMDDWVKLVVFPPRGLKARA
jgi:hypothetical protein